MLCETPKMISQYRSKHHPNRTATDSLCLPHAPSLEQFQDHLSTSHICRLEEADSSPCYPKFNWVYRTMIQSQAPFFCNKLIQPWFVGCVVHLAPKTFASDVPTDHELHPCEKCLISMLAQSSFWSKRQGVSESSTNLLGLPILLLWSFNRTIKKPKLLARTECCFNPTSPFVIVRSSQKRIRNHSSAGIIREGQVIRRDYPPHFRRYRVHGGEDRSGCH